MEAVVAPGLRTVRIIATTEEAMDYTELASVAEAMVATGKGLLAIDESTGTCCKRFAAVGVECTEESRRAYRDTLLTTPGLADHISGVILYDETIRQSTADGQAFVDYLDEVGILPGIKVDTGAKPLALHPDETVTEGLKHCPPPPASKPTRMRWRVTQRSARSPASCRWWSPRY